MPGQYVVPFRRAGTQITELIYNNDHQNHVDGRSAVEMGAYGISLSQFQLTEDPLPGGVESLPPSLAGEITRIRFVLAQIESELSGGEVVNWYDPLIAPGLPVVGAGVQRGSLITIPNNFGTVISFSGAVESFNTGVYDDMAQPTRFTAPVAGKYMAFCSVMWAAASGGRRQLLVGVNNLFSGQQRVSNILPSSVTQPQCLTAILNLGATDYVQFSAFQNSGASLNIIPDAARSIVGGLVLLGS